MLGGMVEQSGKRVEYARVMAKVALKRVYRGCLRRVGAQEACPIFVPFLSHYFQDYRNTASTRPK